MRRALVALVLAVALLAATLPADAAHAATKAKVKCHWVKATKKRKRHKVCVKVKATKKTPAKQDTAKGTGSKPSSPAPSTTTRKPSTSAPAPASPSAPATTPATSPATPPPPIAPDSTPAAPAAARLQATTREWSITLSRPSVAAGALILELVNRGEDAHDLHLRPASGGADLLAIASTEPGGVTDVSGTLAAGTYTLYCALPGHEAAGMKATLTVQ